MAWKQWLGGDKLLAAEVKRIAKASGDNVDITYNSDGTIATVVDNDTSPATTYTLTWSNGLLVSITDGTNTWTFTYNVEGKISNITRT